MNERIATVPTETMDVLMKSDWPGNVTDLEGFIERAVILTEGSTLHAPLHRAVTENHLLQLQDNSSRAGSICQHVFDTYPSLCAHLGI
jgi:DNA-binding NtrC family response regulator